MILYISSKERAGLLDTIAEETGLTISKVVEQKNLNRMIIKDMSNFNHVLYFVIDLSALSDTEEEILAAINAFHNMYHSRVVVITGPYAGSRLIAALVEQGIYNIVTAQDQPGIREQLIKCFSLEGMNQEDAKIACYGYETPKAEAEIEPAGAKPVPPKREPPISANTIPPSFTNSRTPPAIIKPKSARLKQQITIALCGAGRRIGTTHQALLLTAFLHKTGFKVCYLEANNHRSIALLERVYDVDKDPKQAGLISLEGLDMYYGYLFPEVAAKNYEFFVFDFGSFEEIPVEVFLTKDIKIIVGGAKAWELQHYESIYQGIAGYKDLNYILNFVPEGEQSIMLSLLKEYKNQVYFSDYAPYLFDKTVNRHIYLKLFERFLETSTAYEEPPREVKNNGFIGFLNKFKK